MKRIPDFRVFFCKDELNKIGVLDFIDTLVQSKKAESVLSAELGSKIAQAYQVTGITGSLQGLNWVFRQLHKEGLVNYEKPHPTQVMISLTEKGREMLRQDPGRLANARLKREEYRLIHSRC